MIQKFRFSFGLGGGGGGGGEIRPGCRRHLAGFSLAFENIPSIFQNKNGTENENFVSNFYGLSCM